MRECVCVCVSAYKYMTLWQCVLCMCPLPFWVGSLVPRLTCTFCLHMYASVCECSKCVCIVHVYMQRITTILCVFVCVSVHQCEYCTIFMLTIPSIGQAVHGVSVSLEGLHHATLAHIVHLQNTIHATASLVSFPDCSPSVYITSSILKAICAGFGLGLG